MYLAVLASGEGSNLQALIERVHGREGIEIVAVAGDQPRAPALARARAAGIESAAFPLEQHADRAERDSALSAWLEQREVGLVVLAGYMAILSEPFVRRWSGQLINVHPSLLPAFPGLRAVEQAVDHGDSVYGVTVHFVDEGVDSGPIIAQRAVELGRGCSVEEVTERLHLIEHELLPEVVVNFARGEVDAPVSSRSRNGS